MTGCKWCGATTVKTTARYCNACSAPLLDGIPLAMKAGASVGNFLAGAWLRGRYQVRKLLGAGAMGTVYGTLDNNIPGRRVAIKELDTQCISDVNERQGAVELFKDEVQTLAHLDHPGIPKVSDYFVEGTRHYQAMDYVDGYTLEEILTRERVIPENQALAWTQQICAALHYLHTQNPPVVFRDLKPGNIMVDKSGHVKIIDFGIARRFKVGKSKDTRVMGTPGFAPPEQYGRGQTDARSDIYSLSATLYAMVTGFDVSQSPFTLPPVRSFAPAISPMTEYAINRGLELDPNKRWQSIQEMASHVTGAPISVGGTVPVGAVPTGRPGGIPLGDVPTVRPRLTERLGAMMAEWSSAQLVTALLALTATTAAATWILTPTLVRVPLFWQNVDMSAIIAPLAFAGIRKRWVTGIAQGVVASVGGVITQAQVGYVSSAAAFAIGYALLSAIFVEAWLYYLPRWRGKGDEAWKREWALVAAMAILATIIARLAYGVGYAAQPGILVTSAILGGAGWFLGDLIQQTLFFRQKNFQRQGHL